MTLQAQIGVAPADLVVSASPPLRWIMNLALAVGIVPAIRALRR